MAASSGSLASAPICVAGTTETHDDTDGTALPFGRDGAAERLDAHRSAENTIHSPRRSCAVSVNASMWRMERATHALYADECAAVARDTTPPPASPFGCVEIVRVRVPIERAWPLLIDVPRWPQWAFAIGAVMALDDDAPRLGARFALRIAALQRATFRVVALDEPRRLALVARWPGLRARIQLDADALRDGTTRVIVRIDLAGPLAKTAWHFAGSRMAATTASIATAFGLHAELAHELDALA